MESAPARSGFNIAPNLIFGSLEEVEEEEESEATEASAPGEEEAEAEEGEGEEEGEDDDPCCVFPCVDGSAGDPGGECEADMPHGSALPRASVCTIER
jgi:hypothetical protein